MTKAHHPSVILWFLWMMFHLPSTAAEKSTNNTLRTTFVPQSCSLLIVHSDVLNDVDKLLALDPYPHDRIQQVSPVRRQIETSKQMLHNLKENFMHILQEPTSTYRTKRSLYSLLGIADSQTVNKLELQLQQTSSEADKLRAQSREMESNIRSTTLFFEKILKNEEQDLSNLTRWMIDLQTETLIHRYTHSLDDTTARLTDFIKTFLFHQLTGHLQPPPPAIHQLQTIQILPNQTVLITESILSTLAQHIQIHRLGTCCFIQLKGYAYRVDCTTPTIFLQVDHIHSKSPKDVCDLTPAQTLDTSERDCTYYQSNSLIFPKPRFCTFNIDNIAYRSGWTVPEHTASSFDSKSINFPELLESIEKSRRKPHTPPSESFPIVVPSWTHQNGISQTFFTQSSALLASAIGVSTTAALVTISIYFYYRIRVMQERVQRLEANQVASLLSATRA